MNFLRRASGYVKKKVWSTRAVAVIAIGLFVTGNSYAVEFVETDVCVFGATSGGVTAAVQAARMGKSVTLVSVDAYVGGMTASGLGATDIGNPEAIYGLSRDFYIRVAKKYNPAATGPRFDFEPKVANAVFHEMLQDAAVPVYYNQRLASAQMAGNRIQTITMENGNVFRAKMFIDCTYEGDLMARAGVSYTVGREPNSQYGENLSGVQVGRAKEHQIINGVDPYVIPGDPSSGLIPYVNPGPLGADGTGDARVQAFCFRICLTNDPANRIAITQPEDYDEAEYEVLFRMIEAEVAANPNYLGSFWSTHGMPNKKTDSNNLGGVSLDFIGGGSDEWAEATYERRDEIQQAHERWQRGLIWTIQNHPRVPQNIRTARSVWGLPKDEFLATGGWPHQLYVREARRMVSDYVMTEKDCRGSVVVDDSVGLAAYTMDSHNVQRHVKMVNGVPMVKNEGDVQVTVLRPYPISYRSIVPKVGECENLFVTFALSASHMGFGSCRMEPVLMVTSQSAATAASFAIDGNIPVQEVSYPELQAQLLADGQALTWGQNSAPYGLVVDNSDSAYIEVNGAWLTSNSSNGFTGLDYLHDDSKGKGTKTVLFKPDLPYTDDYEVYARWTSHSNRASNVPIEVHHAGAGSPATVFVDQRERGGDWVLLGVYPFNAGVGGIVKVSNTGTTGYVVADSVQFVAKSQLPPPTVELWTTVGAAREPMSAGGAPVAGIFTIRRTGYTDTPLEVNYTLGGTATSGLDFTALSGVATIPVGKANVTVSINPVEDLLAEGTETLSVHLTNGPYLIGELNTAHLTIADRPFDAWRKQNFTQAQLDDPLVSGDLADPDGDGHNTLSEFLNGGNPTVADFTPAGILGQVAASEAVHLTYQFTRTKSSDVAVFAEVTSNLADWNSGPEVIKETVIADDGETQTILAQDLEPSEEHGDRYMRLSTSRK